MKIIQSKNYRIEKISQLTRDMQPRISTDDWHEKLQRIMENVSQGMDTHQAINMEFNNLSATEVEKIKLFVLGALGREIPSDKPELAVTW